MLYRKALNHITLLSGDFYSYTQYLQTDEKDHKGTKTDVNSKVESQMCARFIVKINQILQEEN